MSDDTTIEVNPEEEAIVTEDVPVTPEVETPVTPEVADAPAAE